MEKKTAIYVRVYHNNSLESERSYRFFVDLCSNSRFAELSVRSNGCRIRCVAIDRVLNSKMVGLYYVSIGCWQHLFIFSEVLFGSGFI